MENLLDQNLLDLCIDVPEGKRQRGTREKNKAKPAAAKAKAEAPPKRTREEVEHGGNTNSDLKKKKGRPRRDLHVRAIAIVQEFMAADLENRGFFGDKFTRKRDYLKQLLRDLVAKTRGSGWGGSI